MKSSDILLSLEHHDLEVWKVKDEVCVCYENAQVKDSMFLISAFGRGPDFESACDDYLNQIRGKKVIFKAFEKTREEVTILG